MNEPILPTLLFPGCAVHPNWLANFSCDRCGVFYCDHCIHQVAGRNICTGCKRQPHSFSRDLVTEGHISAIANFNYVISAFSVVALILAYNQTSLLENNPARELLLISSLLVFGVLPLWLGYNLRRYWPAGRAFQLFLSMGLLGIGCLLFFSASSDLKIQGFLLADYNFAILYVLVSNTGSVCFTPRYKEVRSNSPGQVTKRSSLYLLFVFWVALTLMMTWNTIALILGWNP